MGYISQAFFPYLEYDPYEKNPIPRSKAVHLQNKPNKANMRWQMRIENKKNKIDKMMYNAERISKKINSSFRYKIVRQKKKSESNSVYCRCRLYNNFLLNTIMLVAINANENHELASFHSQ